MARRTVDLARFRIDWNSPHDQRRVIEGLAAWQKFLLLSSLWVAGLWQGRSFVFDSTKDPWFWWLVGIFLGLVVTGWAVEWARHRLMRKVNWLRHFPAFTLKLYPETKDTFKADLDYEPRRMPPATVVEALEAHIDILRTAHNLPETPEASSAPRAIPARQDRRPSGRNQNEIPT